MPNPPPPQPPGSQRSGLLSCAAAWEAQPIVAATIRGTLPQFPRLPEPAILPTLLRVVSWEGCLELQRRRCLFRLPSLALQLGGLQMGTGTGSPRDTLSPQPAPARLERFPAR